MLSCFYLIPERYGHTDRRTDIRSDLLRYINIARQYADARYKAINARGPSDHTALHLETGTNFLRSHWQRLFKYRKHLQACMNKAGEHFEHFI